MFATERGGVSLINGILFSFSKNNYDLGEMQITYSDVETGLSVVISVKEMMFFCYFPKFLDRNARVNCHSICIFWEAFHIKKANFFFFTLTTAMFLVSKTLALFVSKLSREQQRC